MSIWDKLMKKKEKVETPDTEENTVETQDGAEGAEESAVTQLATLQATHDGVVTENEELKKQLAEANANLEVYTTIEKVEGKMKKLGSDANVKQLAEGLIEKDEFSYVNLLEASMDASVESKKEKLETFTESLSEDVGEGGDDAEASDFEPKDMAEALAFVKKEYKLEKRAAVDKAKDLFPSIYGDDKKGDE